MGLRKKVPISSFVQSRNFERLTLTGFEPATLRVAVGHHTHYTKFPYENFFEKIFNQILQSFCGSVASQTSSNQRFRLKSCNSFYQFYSKTYYQSDQNYYQIVAL